MNSRGFLAAKFISLLVFLVCAKGGVRHWKCGRLTVVDLGMTFVDNWVVGKEEVCYWLSNDIVGLMTTKDPTNQIMNMVKLMGEREKKPGNSRQ